MAWEWRLSETNCIGCGICADVCPSDAIEMTRDMALPRSVPDACTGCLTCEEECPFDAIRVAEVEGAFA